MSPRVLDSPVLTALAEAGVGISLDDFGRGQTSLGYLSALPVHELKIDRSFVTDMWKNTAHAAIVRSIVDLGHNLCMRVVAEGVETDEVLARLTDYGCDLAQGFLLARPMPAENLSQCMAQRGNERRGPGARSALVQRGHSASAAAEISLGRKDCDREASCRARSNSSSTTGRTT